MSIIAHPHVTLWNGRWGVLTQTGQVVPALRIYLWHRKGATFETLFKRYPGLGPAKVLSAVAFAYDNPDTMAAEERGADLVTANPQGKLRAKRPSGAP